MLNRPWRKEVDLLSPQGTRQCPLRARRLRKPLLDVATRSFRLHPLKIHDREYWKLAVSVTESLQVSLRHMPLYQEFLVEVGLM